MRDPFWFVDDEHRTRWAVRVSRVRTGLDDVVEFDDRIVFTCTERQISTAFFLDQEEHELTRQDLLELLTRAKAEAVSAAGFGVGGSGRTARNVHHNPRPEYNLR